MRDQVAMSGFGDYDAWKTMDPADRYGPCDTCDQCGGLLERSWPSGWRCDRCDDEREYRERQLDEEMAA